jgi:hypothetical protein
VELSDLLDVGAIPDGSPLAKKVRGAVEELYEAMHEIKDTSRHAARLTERAPLVYPVKGRDMRTWLMSDGRKASALITGRQASRIAGSRKVVANPTLSRYRAMTASQYLAALEDAVITEYRPVTANRGYERVKVLV